jgi:hypothetical protein
MPTLADRFHAHLRRRRLFPGPGTVLVAVSGGAESVALLDLLAGAAADLKLRLVVAHADHGIHPESGTVAEAVARLAARYRLPCEVGRLDLGAGTSETVARRARYAWLDATRRRIGASGWPPRTTRTIQAERSCCARCEQRSRRLAGIPARTRAGIERPLLPFTRAELAAHTTRVGCRSTTIPRTPIHVTCARGCGAAVLPTLVARLGVRVRTTWCASAGARGGSGARGPRHWTGCRVGSARRHGRLRRCPGPLREYDAPWRSPCCARLLGARAGAPGRGGRDAW